jgi:hypothetical protein
MYGIVNKAIQGLITDNHGKETWEKIKQKCAIETDLFLSNEAYPDKITYDLAIAASETLGISVDEVLVSFGEYWVMNTGQKSYGSLMQAGGDNLKQFLVNLPNFHSRVMLIYPNLTPPEFKITDIKDSELVLHYYSSRLGLKYFVYGLIQGLGKLYKCPTTIEIIKSREDGSDHDVFHVKW